MKNKCPSCFELKYVGKKRGQWPFSPSLRGILVGRRVRPPIAIPNIIRNVHVNFCLVGLVVSSSVDLKGMPSDPYLFLSF
jgi:hypothetical protein